MPSIFISYSHKDSSLVGPVVALLRASEALVFQDADSISPGKRWREEVGTAISSASVVVVFWCRHARASKEVENEITAAISQHKDVLPLLLDETPLPSHMAEFQYIDFRAAFGKGHGLEPDHSKAGKKLFWAAGLLVGLIIIAAMVVPSSLSNLAQEGPPDESVGLWPTSLWLIVLLIGVVLFIAARKRRTERNRAPDAIPMPARLMPYTRLARAIEEELLRRTGAP